MPLSVSLFVLFLILLLVFITVYRIRQSKEQFYTNSKCRVIILDVTNKYLDKNLDDILTNRQYMGDQLIIKEIINIIYTEYDRRVYLYYTNNSKNMSKLITSIIVKRIDKLK